MVKSIELADEADFIRRYQAGVSLKQLSVELGVSRCALARVLRLQGVERRDRSASMVQRWQAERATPDWRERLMQAAWQAADDRNLTAERQALSLYRAGLTSQARIGERLGLAKPTVGGILRRRGMTDNLRTERRAAGNSGGFNTAMQCALEPAFAEVFTRLGLDYIHQYAIGSRNVDFAFPAERIAVEIVRRHWNDAKSLRRERLEQIIGAGWRLWMVYDPAQRGIAVDRCCQHLVACLEVARRSPALPGQYWMIGGDGQPLPEPRLKLHQFARIEEPLTQPSVSAD